MSEPRVRCFALRDGSVSQIGPDEAALEVEPERVHDPAAEPRRFVWIDILDPTEPEALYLRERVGMHPLAVEDCLRGRQRPKIERYPGYSFLVFYSTRINPDRERMALSELHIFLGADFIITVHDQPIPEVTEAIANWRATPSRFRDAGTASYAVIDALTDNYFPVVEHYSDRLDALEERIFAGDPDVSMHDAIRFRQEMILLRRILGPQRDVLSSLVRREPGLIHPDLLPYFQDVHDHTLRVAEEIDAFRDLVTGLVEVQSSNAANRLNETMQTLTGWSIILMSMALVAGIYGMNFARMPELQWRFGYPIAIGLMVAICVALLVLFRRRGWL